MKKANNKNSNIKVKIACMFFAFFMWMYVMTDLDPIDTREISAANVTITNLNQIQDNNLTLSPEQDIKASAVLKGRRSVISKKIKDGVKLQATIQNPKIGLNTAQIVVAGDNTDINYIITPSTLDIKLEGSKVKPEKIYIKSIGSLAQNYYIDTIKLSKDNLYVSGPESLIDKIEKAEAEIDLNNVAQDFSKMSRVKFLDKDSNEIEGLSSDTQNVVITVKVKKEKTVPIKANINSDNSNFELIELNIEPDSLKIQGSPTDIDSIKVIETKKIDIDTLFKNKTMDVDLVLPNNVYSNTKIVKLKSLVEKNGQEHKSSEFEYSKEEIELKNAQDLTEKQLSKINIPDLVSFNFVSTDNQIKKEDIQLYIDAKDIENKKLAIKYITQKDIQEVKINPEYIDIVEDINENE